MYVTLNIGTTSLTLLSVKSGKVKNWGKTPLAPGLVSDGFILQPKAVGVAIDALFKSMNLPKGRVIVSLTGLSFTYRILSLPMMSPDFLEEAIQRGVRKEIPLPLEELSLSWQVINSRHDELDFFVLGVPQNLIEAVSQTLVAAGIKPYLMDLKPLALARATNRTDALIIDLEPDCFDIVLVANGIPVIMHTITPRGAGARLEDNIHRLADELSKTVKFYDSSHPDSPFSPTTPLVLTGELADATAKQLIQAEVEYPVEPLVPPLELPPDLPVATYASNIGLALKKTPRRKALKGGVSNYHDVNLDILSGKHGTGATRVPLRYILAPLAFAIAIGLLFPLYQVKSQSDAKTLLLQAELNSLSQQLHEARLAINEAGQIEDTIGEISAAADALQEEHQYILGKRGEVALDLKSVTGALPSAAYFTYVEIATDRITVEGEANNAFTVVSYTTALEATGEFSEVRIAEIHKSENQETGVSFTVVIRK